MSKTLIGRAGLAVLCSVSLGLATSGPSSAFVIAPHITGPAPDVLVPAQQVPGTRGGPNPPAPPAGNTDVAGEANDSIGRLPSTAPAPRGSVPATPAVTSQIVSLINNISGTCEPAGAAYRVDCIANELLIVADSLPKSGDYSMAKSVLLETADELEMLSRANRDNTQPRIRVTLPADETRETTPVITAVKPAVVAATNAAAIEILDNATTVLLRSTENSEERAFHYQQIAQAVDSNKLLLRS